MGIYFLCSCETEWHEENKLRGHADIPLSNTGRERARGIRDSLAKMNFDIAICSPLDRAYETAMLAVGDRGIPITFDPRIIERDCGDLEGSITPPDFWEKDYPCAEPLSDFTARIQDFLRKTVKKHNKKNVLIVSHSGVSIALETPLKSGGFCECTL